VWAALGGIVVPDSPVDSPGAVTLLDSTQAGIKTATETPTQEKRKARQMPWGTREHHSRGIEVPRKNAKIYQVLGSCKLFSD
jgi:hypothetical protein